MVLGEAALDVLDELDEAELPDLVKVVGMNVLIMGVEDEEVNVSMMVDVVSPGSTVVVGPLSSVPHGPSQATI